MTVLARFLPFDILARLEHQQNAHQPAVGAVLSNLEAWIGKKEGHVTYRLMQILTGLGCFSEHLNKIGREETAQCHLCAANQDSAQVLPKLDKTCLCQQISDSVGDKNR